MDPSQIDLALARIRTALEAGEVQAAIDTLTDLHPVDRADAFSDLDDKDQAALLPQLDLQATADLLEELEDEQAAAVAETFGTEQLAHVWTRWSPMMRLMYWATSLLTERKRHWQRWKRLAMSFRFFLSTMKRLAGG